MLRLIFISIVALLLISCAKDSIVINTIEKKPFKELNITTIARIAIPVRESGYSNFNTILLTSQNGLDKFISKIKLQKNWNNRDNFLNALKLKKIDFTKYNFLIYRITEASGSTVLLVRKPKGDKSNITIKIGKNSQEMKTDDMAYYALGYKVSKDIAQITFKNGEKTEVIPNTTTTESPKQQKPVDEPSHHDTELEKLPHSPQLSNE